MAMLSHNDLIALLEKIKAGAASDEELAQLIRLIDSDQDGVVIRLIMEFHAIEPSPAIERLEPYDKSYWQQMLAGLKVWPPQEANVITPVSTPVRRMFRWRNWGWAAAAVILMISAGVWLWSNKTVRKEEIVKQVKDVAPGKNGAILTLADGSNLVLDSLGNGLVTRQEGTQVMLTEGHLAYEKENGNRRSVYNTVSTPRGRQFHITLPDGTGVWLNAASSIRFQTAFPANERRVEITGEVYFEVVKNTRKPFVAVLEDKTAVEVLGTHFNVNAYRNEEASAVTLLEGKVKVSKGAVTNMLKPGQQAVIANASSAEMNINRDIDVEKAIAWKNGFFNFDGMMLKQAMKQIERWYDVNVVYEKGVIDTKLYGELTRNTTLQELIKALSYTGIKVKIEGNKLTVMK